MVTGGNVGRQVTEEEVRRAMSQAIVRQVYPSLFFPPLMSEELMIECLTFQNFLPQMFCLKMYILGAVNGYRCLTGKDGN